MNIKELYSVEVLFSDGRVEQNVGVLKGASRVSFIPAEGSGLPKHDLIGKNFKRRFLRYFKRTIIGGFNKEAYWEGVNVLASPERQKAREGKLKSISEPKPNYQSDACVQCIVMSDSRLYLNVLTGAVLITPFDYELYL